MIYRHILSTMFILILLPFTLWGQILDDSWHNDFQASGFRRWIKDIGIDSRGVIVARIGDPIPEDISPYFLHDGNGWHHIPLPFDTVRAGVSLSIIRDRYSTALFPTGEILADSRMVITGSRNTLRFDRLKQQWRQLLPVPLGSVVYGQDGRFYSTVRDTATGRLMVLGTVGSTIDTVATDIPPDLRLLGASARSTLFLTNSRDSIYVLQNGRLEVTILDQPNHPGGDTLAYTAGKESLFVTRTFYIDDSTTSELRYHSVIHRIAPDSPVETIPLPENNAVATMWEEENYSAGSIVERNDGTLFVATIEGLFHWDGEGWSRMDTSCSGSNILETPTGDIVAFCSSKNAHALHATCRIATYHPNEDEWSLFHNRDGVYNGLTDPGLFTEIGDDYIRIGEGRAIGNDDPVQGEIIEFRDGEWEVILENSDLPELGIIQKISDGADGCYIAELLPQVGLDRRRGVRIYHHTVDTLRLIGDSDLFTEQYIDLVVHRDTLYAIAMYRDTNSYLRSRIVRFADDRWTLLYDSSHVNSPQLLSDGHNLYIGGNIEIIPHDSNGIALFREGRMVPLGGGLRGPGPSRRITSLAGDGENIWVGGSFAEAGDSATHAIARWDGVAWHPLEAGLFDPDRENYGPGGTVSSIAVTDNVIAVVGEFTAAGDPDPLAPMHVDLGYGAAFWDRSLQSWNRLGTAFADPILTGYHGSPLRVNAVGDTLWFTGHFDFAGGERATGLANFVVPPVHIFPPETPEILDFGFVLPGDTGVAWLPVLNPPSSTRTMRARIDEFDSPFSIDFDGRFQAASGQTKFLPIRVVPDRSGVLYDTVMISYGDSYGSVSGEAVPVVLRVRSSILSVDAETGSVETPDLSIGPNPVERLGHITVRTTDRAVVRVTIYGLDGRKVTDLFHGEVIGEKSLLWNAEDLPSGPYLCRLSRDGEEISRIVILR